MAKNEKPEKAAKIGKGRKPVAKAATEAANRRRQAQALRRVRAATKRAVTAVRRKAAPRGKVPAHGTPPEIAPQPIQDPAALKFVVSEPAAPQTFSAAPEFEFLGELPESYATQRVWLVARDPHWFHAHWDFSWDQLRDATSRAADQKVFLRLVTVDGHLVQQNEVPPGCRSWYIHTAAPGAAFVAEVGVYRPGGSFEAWGRSGAADAPKDYVSPDSTARFVTIPMHFTFRQLLELVAGNVRDGEDLADALARLQGEGFRFPFDVGIDPDLSDARMSELYQFLGGELVRRINMGSFEITEILRQRLQKMLVAGSASMFSPMGGSFAGGGGDRGFHLNVNAELILYGGTEPRARVRVGGKEIELRDDGTFRFHFLFPDGKFFIPVEATSPDGTETRGALVSFVRVTDASEAVGASAQPAELGAPLGKG